jgi:hypothetical protein
MKQKLTLLDCIVVLSGISSFVFLFMYVGTLSSPYLHGLIISGLACYFSIATAEAIRMKKESERLSRFVRRMK